MLPTRRSCGALPGERGAARDYTGPSRNRVRLHPAEHARDGSRRAPACVSGPGVSRKAQLRRGQDAMRSGRLVELVRQRLSPRRAARIVAARRARALERLAPVQERPHEAANVYGNLAAWNFSSAVLARIPEQLIAVRVDNLHWNDWGTEASIEHSFRLLNRKPPWHAPPLSHHREPPRIWQKHSGTA